MNYRYLLLILAFCSFANAQTYLTPLDFGLSLMDHGRVDYCNTPPNIQVGNYNSDCYPDIARFNGNKLEIFLFMGKGYTPEPQQSRTFQKQIKSLKHDDNIWDGIDDLVVTFEDNSEKTFHHNRGCLNLNGTKANLKNLEIPRRVSEADFEIVWESEPRGSGMNRCAVGDLDNDGIMELVTWYKHSGSADSAFFLIYKCTGDDEYELFMEEPVYIEDGGMWVTHMLIGDLDQNGQNELIYTYNKVYIWEFSEPGVYWIWTTSIHFERVVQDMEICDVDQDGILELAILSSSSSYTPPAHYRVKEFGLKVSWPNYAYAFTTISSFWHDYADCRIDVADFNNNGVVDIVTGNVGSVWSYDPIDIQYFRYDTTHSDNFVQEFLHTGIPLSCVTPVVADLNNDGLNELFAGGLYPNGGSAFIWEGDGPSGYIAWVDTVNSPNGPNEASFGIVDWNPSIISIHIIPGAPSDSKLLLWSRINSSYTNSWQSLTQDSISYQNPYLIDTDSDGKRNIVLAGGGRFTFVGWEQISASVQNPGENSAPHNILLLPNYPNPFNSSTVIPFELSIPSDIQLSIFDIAGRVVHRTIEENVAPGHYSIDWHAAHQSSGIYLIELIAGEEKQIIKGVLLK